jgi:plasmid stabilization system protein ParE
MLDVEFTDAALDDYQRAFNWYSVRIESAATRFAAAFERALLEVRRDPRLWPSVSRRVRYRKLMRYAYCIYYRILANTAFVVAVAHGRRRFGYWKRRK